ncbi:MAG TPA: hypothetical protein VFA18_13195, partial [Gemmataceae bacterium]|nr:hypothetical protein [Gemmataceae bacterium]
MGLGSIAACWHWLRWGGRTRHQRYQVEEHQRRKRLQAHPTFKQLEHRGSPGVPVDPAAMLLAGYTGLAIMPHQLLQAPLPAVVEQPTGSGTPRRALADDERRPAGAAPAVTITAANAPRANVSAAPSTASTDTDNTAVTNPDPRLWRPLQPLLGRQDVLPEMFPATEHLGPDGDSSQPLPAPLPGGGGGVLLDTPSITPASTPAP